MSKKEKMVKRILSKPKDYTINELDSLMHLCNCLKNNRGGSSGSAIKYIGKGKHELRIHRPHPSNIVPRYVIEAAISFLQEEGEIK